VAFIAGAMLTPALARRVRPGVLMAAGLLVAAGGYGYFVQVDESSGFVGYALASIVFSFASAPVFTLTNDLIIGTAPPERAGAAAGISETSAEFSGALGIAVFGSIGVAAYRRILAGADLPDVPAGAMDAALGTLGGALAVAADLPTDAAAELLHAARAAFVVGLRICAALSVVGSAALAAFVFVRLRGMTMGGAEPHASEPDAPPTQFPA
jgi:DHA2 family multidrug resistance protein-like MFS transporter